MANPNNPFGFRPIIRLGGGPYSVTEYGKPSADANAIFAFDLVGYLTGAPLALPENANYNLPRIQSGSQLTPGTSLWLGASLAYGAASTGTVHPVTDEIDVVYIAQADGSVTTSAHVHKNANVQLSQAGSTTTKQSGMQVNSSSIATTSSLDLRIQRISMISPNAEGANAILEVTINKHAMAQASAGV
ncbi:MAG: hypothetical protein JO345_21950 [Streptosporangiaceae bacterium]|nr:hypothetical protein [Streptosporangiaceae bacterium]